MKLNFDYDKQQQMSDDYASLGRNASMFTKGLIVTQSEFSFEKHKFPTIMRIVPYFMHGQPTPTISNKSGETKLGAWIIKLPVVTMMGSAEKTGFILFDPFNESAGSYDANKNPYLVLRRRIAKAVRDKATFRGISCQAWEGLLKGRDAVLPAFRDYYYVQALVYTDGLNLTIDNQARPLGLHSKDKTLVVVRLSKSAHAALKSQVLHYAEQGIDFLANPGYYVGLGSEQVVKPADVDYELYQQTIQQNQTLLNPADNQGGFGTNMALLNMMAQSGKGGGDGSDEEFVKYSATICRVARFRDTKHGIDTPYQPQDYTQLATQAGQPGTWWDEIKAKHLSWDALFEIKSDQEQAVMIARALADKSELLEYGWGDTEYLTEEVRQILSRARHVAVSASLLGDDVVVPAVGTAAIREFVSSQIPVGHSLTPQQVLDQQQARQQIQQAQIPQPQQIVQATNHAPIPGTTQEPRINNVF